MKSVHMIVVSCGLIAAGVSACAPAQSGMGPMAGPPPAPVMMDHSREGGIHGNMQPMRPVDPTASSGRPSLSPTGAINPGGTAGSRN